MKKTNPWTHSPMLSEIWIPTSDNWAWFSNHQQHVWSALVWGAVTQSRPCVADSRTVGQLRAHRQQCLTHPQFSIVQTNANQATADTVDGLRRNCTRWGMDVDPGREDRIELDGSRDGRNWIPTPRPCSWLSPTFCSNSKHCFSIVFVVIWNAIVFNKYPSIVAFIGNRGEAKHFFIKSLQTFLVKVSGKFPKKKGTKCKIIRRVKW